jgi:hypothetical protein
MMAQKNENYYRYCPTCNIKLFYSDKRSLNNSTRVNANCRSCATKKYDIKKSNLSVLCNRNNIFYYWLGFILADGHIGDNNRLTITLSNKDINHLHEFANFIKCDIKSVNKINRQHSCIRVMDSDIFSIIRSDFDIKTNKTKNPPNCIVFDVLTDDELLCIFTGFVDGDGCIMNLQSRKDFSLRIKCHGSWITILEYFNNRLQLNGTCKINNQGYSMLGISNSVTLKLLKRNVERLNIPTLKRKWDIIDYNFIGRNELAVMRKHQIIELINQDKSITEMSKTLKIKYGTVLQIIIRNKLK